MPITRGERSHARRPRRAGRAGAAAKIDDRRDVRRRAGQRSNDVGDQQMVERPVKQREGRALAGAGQRRALASFSRRSTYADDNARSARDTSGNVSSARCLRLERAIQAIESFVGGCHV